MQIFIQRDEIGDKDNRILCSTVLYMPHEFALTISSFHYFHYAERAYSKYEHA